MALTAEQLKIVNSKAFKDWFNGSKVVSEDGLPLIVWHGGAKDFHVFDRAKLGSSQGNSPANKWGFYFSDNRKVAHSFANMGRVSEDKKSLVKPYFLNLRNPKILDCKGESYNTIKHKINDLIEKAKYPKYDGIILLNYSDSMHANPLVSNQYVVHEPEQIKIADGSNSEFNNNEPDVRFSKGGGVSGGLKKSPKGVSYTKNGITVTIIPMDASDEDSLYGRRAGRMYLTIDGVTKEHGYWMDFTEDDWNISDEDYYALPIEDRMEMECKEQFRYNLRNDFRSPHFAVVEDFKPIFEQGGAVYRKRILVHRIIFGTHG